MMVAELTSRNFELFAARNYTNPHCLDPDEFRDDLSRFKYVKKLLTRYVDKGDLQERLILNHLITLYNVFEINAANTMVFFRTCDKTKPALKTFLIFLNYLQSDKLPEIPVDLFVAKRLKAI